MITGPIIIIDDDYEDIGFIKEAFESLGVKNELIDFDDAYDALDFFEKTQAKPFLVLCDINMPKLNGLEVRKRIFEDDRLRIKTVPFLFLSTGGEHPAVNAAYNLAIQGYFLKPNTIEAYQEMLKNIVDYWTYCQHPFLANSN